ncbi:MAG TPA: thiamine phosphate synthase [Rhodothermales bacterium]
MALGRLHVLTDFHFQQRFSHAELCALAVRGGADTMQFRQKFGGIRHRLLEARRAQAVCQEAGVPFVINDALDIALAIGAAGVHLGQADFPIAEARRLLPPDAIVGATASSVREAERAWRDGATYIGFGPVFPTNSKANPTAVRGLDGLAAVCAAVPIPVIAIAGITAARIASVIDAGAYGVAVMTAITNADDPEAATRAVREALDEALGD